MTVNNIKTNNTMQMMMNKIEKSIKEWLNKFKVVLLIMIILQMKTQIKKKQERSISNKPLTISKLNQNKKEEL